MVVWSMEATVEMGAGSMLDDRHLPYMYIQLST